MRSDICLPSASLCDSVASQGHRARSLKTEDLVEYQAGDKPLCPAGGVTSLVHQESRARRRVCSELFQEVAPASGALAREETSWAALPSFHFLPGGGCAADVLERSDLSVPFLPSCQLPYPVSSSF